MTATDQGSGTKGGAIAFIRLARPHQYTKNLFVFLPAFFGCAMVSGRAFGYLCVVFAVFCLLASSIYALNDVLDSQEDRKHPVKRLRPVARGLVSRGQALAFGCCLLAGAAALLWIIGDWRVALVSGGYVVLNLAYCLGLKHKSLIDVSCISLGFILRVVAGSYPVNVPVSPWLMLMTYLLAMFLALGKRWDDLRIVEEGGQQSARRSLDGYTPDFVRTAMVVMASVNLVAYIMYTTSDKIVQYYGTDTVFMTAVWVVTGFLRYMQITLVENGAGSPARVFLRDRFIQILVGGWILHLSILLYSK